MERHKVRHDGRAFQLVNIVHVIFVPLSFDYSHKGIFSKITKIQNDKVQIYATEIEMVIVNLWGITIRRCRKRVQTEIKYTIRQCFLAWEFSPGAV